VLSRRRQVAGVIEARGAIELHHDGFRAEQARPFALFLAPGANAALVGRLAETYAAEVVPASAPGAVVDWCRARGLGLEQGVVDELLGPERLAERRRSLRLQRLRAAAALVMLVLALAIGLAATSDPGDRTLFGRTGEVHPR
jgi:hypothetical protein